MRRLKSREHRIKYKLAISLITVLFICVSLVNVSSARQQDVFITLDNVEQLELQIKFPGRCDQFSPNDQFVATTYGRRTIFDIASQQPILETDGLFGNFSLDGNLFYAEHDGVYNLSTGSILFEVPGMMNDMNISNFSPDGKLIAISRYGVYDLSGTNIFEISSYGVFSPDGHYLAVLGKIYETTHWKAVFIPSTDGKPSFSPDSKWLAVSGDGVYSTAAWEKAFNFTVNAPGMYLDSIFSDDSTLIAVPNDGVYDVVSGLRLLEIHAKDPSFSPNNHYFASSDDGLYDTVTWKRQFMTENSGSFNSDGTLYSVFHDGIYDTSNGERVSVLSGLFSPEGHFLAVTPDDEGQDKESTNCFIYAVRG